MLPGTELGAALLPRAGDLVPVLLGLGAGDDLLSAGRAGLPAGQRLCRGAADGSATGGPTPTGPTPTALQLAGRDGTTAGASTRRPGISQRRPDCSEWDEQSV